MQQALSCILLVRSGTKNKVLFGVLSQTPHNILYEQDLASGSASIRYMARAKARGFVMKNIIVSVFWGADSFGTGVGVLSVSLYQGKTLTGVQIGGAGGLGDMQRPGITQRRGYRFFARR